MCEYDDETNGSRYKRNDAYHTKGRHYGLYIFFSGITGKAVRARNLFVCRVQTKKGVLRSIWISKASEITWFFSTELNLQMFFLVMMESTIYCTP